MNAVDRLHFTASAPDADLQLLISSGGHTATATISRKVALLALAELHLALGTCGAPFTPDTWWCHDCNLPMRSAGDGPRVCPNCGTSAEVKPAP